MKIYNRICCEKPRRRISCAPHFSRLIFLVYRYCLLPIPLFALLSRRPRSSSLLNTQAQRPTENTLTTTFIEVVWKFRGCLDALIAGHLQARQQITIAYIHIYIKIYIYIYIYIYISSPLPKAMPPRHRGRPQAPRRRRWPSRCGRPRPLGGRPQGSTTGE